MSGDALREASDRTELEFRTSPQHRLYHPLRKTEDGTYLLDIMLTGGGCAGKTMAMEYVREMLLKNYACRVIRTREAATDVLWAMDATESSRLGDN